jgi:LacI family transcriptional regulator
MVRRPTIADVAQTAGVSVATVDRVLNGRSARAGRDARRVYEAAQGTSAITPHR